MLYKTSHAMNIPPSLTLTTSRCTLRSIAKEDMPHVFHASQFPGFTDGMLWEPPERVEDLREYHEQNLREWEADTAYCFTIETRDPVQFIGRIIIRKQPEEDTWDLGFWTHPEQQGRGFMTEACQAVMAFGFETLKATNIIACHALWNRASECVLKKNGMQFLKHIPQGFQKNGEWVEENLLGITREQWDLHT